MPTFHRSRYGKARADLLSLQHLGMKFGLNNTRTLCALFDHPERRLPAVHIAGTNGKGSTAALLSSILSAAGYRVGLTTSPHLVDLRERIQIDGAPIPRRDLTILIERLTALVERHRERHPDTPLRPTFFEALTILALAHFRDQAVDIAVVETGLGGRLDSTNILPKPLATILTTIAFDHMEYLGDTLMKIAAEKAGIIKLDAPVITSVQVPDALEVIRSVARRRRAPLSVMGEDFETEWRGKRLTYRSDGMTLSGLSLGLPGRHQAENAAAAVRCVETLRGRGFDIPDRCVREGLANARWPGRLDRREGGGAEWLLDGSHNPNGVDTLVRHLKEAYTTRRIRVIFGAMKDKDYPEVIRRIARLSPEWIFCRVRNDRAASPRNLADALGSQKEIALCASAGRAITLALDRNRPGDLNVITGSLYLVGEALSILKRRRILPST